MGRQQTNFTHRREGALIIGVKRFDAVDFVIKHIQAIGQITAHRENV